MRAGATWPAGDVLDALPLWCSQCRTAAKDDQSLLVSMMEVVREELLAGIDLVHVAGEDFGTELLGDPGLLNSESLVLHFGVARNREHVGDLHIREDTRRAPVMLGGTFRCAGPGLSPRV